MRSTMVLAGAVAVAVGLGCSSANDESSSQSVTALNAAATAADGNPGHISKGEQLFLHEFPGVQGNGRACATCHDPNDHFMLKPTSAQARYAADPTEPLFRSIDADDGADDYTQLTQHGLVHVTIAIPQDDPVAGTRAAIRQVNPDGTPTGATSVTLLRKVPTILDVKFTAPYQLDMRAPTLQAQALGALVGHAQIQHDPNPDFLDDIAAWQETQLAQPTTDEPQLEGDAIAGKAVFDRSCRTCHDGTAHDKAGTSSADFRKVPALADNIFVSKPAPPFLANDPRLTKPVPGMRVYFWQLRNPDGSWGPTRPSTDPGVIFTTNNPAHFNTFDRRPLRGVKNLAPYFHDNSAADLNAVLDHYLAFFVAVHILAPNSPIDHPFTAAEKPALLAYLNSL